MSRFQRYIVIFVVLTVVVSASAFALAVKPAKAAPLAGCIYHYVYRGQTLASIGAMYGVSWRAIAQANGLWNPNYIQAGWTLCIPTGGGSYGIGGPYYGYNYNYYYNPAYYGYGGPYYGYNYYYNPYYYNPYYYNPYYYGW